MSIFFRFWLNLLDGHCHGHSYEKTKWREFRDTKSCISLRVIFSLVKIRNVLHFGYLLLFKTENIFPFPNV